MSCSVCQRWQAAVLVGLCDNHQRHVQESERRAREMLASGTEDLRKWRRDKREWLEKEAVQCHMRANLYYGNCALIRLLNYHHFRYWKLMEMAAQRLAKDTAPLTIWQPWLIGAHASGMR